jgi:hypothetical protein
LRGTNKKLFVVLQQVPERRPGPGIAPKDPDQRGDVRVLVPADGLEIPRDLDKGIVREGLSPRGFQAQDGHTTGGGGGFAQVGVKCL